MRIVRCLIDMKNLHWYYKFLLVFIVFFSMFFLLNRHISNFINASYYKSAANYISKSISTISDYNFVNYPKIVKENKKIKKELLLKTVSMKSYNNLVNEIAELKNTMKLSSIYTGYNSIYSKTINRNKMYWFSSITIDKGSSDGVAKNQAVVTNNGLVGIVKDTAKHTSIVKLITNSDLNNRISGIIKTEKDSVVGLIEGYDYPYLKVSLATNEESIKVGDKFYTSGLSGIPKNIYIGTVEKIGKDSYDLSSVLYVKPKQDMNDINYVVVLGN